MFGQIACRPERDVHASDLLMHGYLLHSAALSVVLKLVQMFPPLQCRRWQDDAHGELHAAPLQSCHVLSHLHRHR